MPAGEEKKEENSIWVKARKTLANIVKKIEFAVADAPGDYIDGVADIENYLKIAYENVEKHKRIHANRFGCLFGSTFPVVKEIMDQERIEIAEILAKVLFLEEKGKKRADFSDMVLNLSRIRKFKSWDENAYKLLVSAIFYKKINLIKLLVEKKVPIFDNEFLVEICEVKASEVKLLFNSSTPLYLAVEISTEIFDVLLQYFEKFCPAEKDRKFVLGGLQDLLKERLQALANNKLELLEEREELSKDSELSKDEPSWKIKEQRELNKNAIELNKNLLNSVKYALEKLAAVITDINANMKNNFDDKDEKKLFHSNLLR